MSIRADLRHGGVMPESVGTMCDMVAAAELFMTLGWPVFPVIGKTPATTHGLNDASLEQRMAGIWWEYHRERGIALATGTKSGVWVLDLDGQEATAALVALQEKHDKIPFTVTAKTDRGWHLYFRMPPGGDIRNSAGKVAIGVDVRGTGGYVVLPPSPHPTGSSYEWVAGRAPGEVPVAEAPQWLLDLVQGTGQNGRAPIAPLLPHQIHEGARNSTLTSFAGSMRRRGASQEAILAAIEAENTLRCSPPLCDDELRQIAMSVARYTPDPVA